MQKKRITLINGGCLIAGETLPSLFAWRLGAVIVTLLCSPSPPTPTPTPSPLPLSLRFTLQRPSHAHPLVCDTLPGRVLCRVVILMSDACHAHTRLAPVSGTLLMGGGKYLLGDVNGIGAIMNLWSVGWWVSNSITCLCAVCNAKSNAERDGICWTASPRYVDAPLSHWPPAVSLLL